jgi:regulator of replication initiation timing
MDIEDMHKKVDDLVQSKQVLQDQIIGLNIAIKDEQDRSKSLSTELESVRSILEKCEERNQRLEVENAQLVSRFISEKEKMASEMNEMNNIVGGFRGFMGGGVSFVQGLKNSVIGAVHAPSNSSSGAGGGISDSSGSGTSGSSHRREKERSAERSETAHTRSVSSDVPRSSQSSSDDGDDGFEIIDGRPEALTDESGPPSSSPLAAGVQKKRSSSAHSASPPGGRRDSRAGEGGGEDEGRRSLVTDFAPPRCPASIEKIHSMEINDVRTDSNLIVTGGADATVKVTTLGSRDPIFSFLGTAPVLSVDIVDDSWVLGASSGAMSEVRVWSAINGRQRLSFGGHNNKILCARFIGHILHLAT